MPSYILPSKLFSYLRRLLLNYEHLGQKQLAQIIKHGHIAVVEDTDRHYDFGQELYGHEVVIFLPEQMIAPITVTAQGKLSAQLRADLAECAEGIGQEYIHAVRIELVDENDPIYQSSQTLSGIAPVNPAALSFWKADQIRAFISHRDTYKVQAHNLGDALENYGISCFVAHDTIEPTASWQAEIEKALQTMEVFVALITNDFHDSVWTNQEVGFAKARNVPIISVKLGPDPRGFIADKQALKGDVDYPERCAKDIYKLVSAKLKQQDRVQDAVITAFCATPNWNEARVRFDQMDDVVDRISDDQLARIRVAFADNDQLNKAIYLYNGDRLKKFLTRTTGKKFIVAKGEIVPEKQDEDDEIPF